MHKLHTYWWAVRSSLQDPNYYFSLQNTAVWFSVQFFFFSLFLIAVCMIPNFAYRHIPNSVAFVRSELTAIASRVPEDAVFTYADDQLTIHGVSLPLTIDASPALQQSGMPKSILTLSAQDQAASTPLTLGPTQIFVRDEQGNVSQAKLQEFFGDVTGSLSRDQIRSQAFAILNAVEAARVQLAIVLSVGALIASILYGVFAILIYSVVIQVIGWAFGCRLTYRTAARWGLHLFPIAYGIGELSKLLDTTGTFPIVPVAYIAIGTLILWVGRTTRPTITL